MKIKILFFLVILIALSIQCGLEKKIINNHNEILVENKSFSWHINNEDADEENFDSPSDEKYTIYLLSDNRSIIHLRSWFGLMSSDKIFSCNWVELSNNAILVTGEIELNITLISESKIRVNEESHFFNNLTVLSDVNGAFDVSTWNEIKGVWNGIDADGIFNELVFKQNRLVIFKKDNEILESGNIKYFLPSQDLVLLDSGLAFEIRLVVTDIESGAISQIEIELMDNSSEFPTIQLCRFNKRRK